MTKGKSQEKHTREYISEKRSHSEWTYTSRGEELKGQKKKNRLFFWFWFVQSMLISKYAQLRYATVYIGKKTGR